jgi:hypothetical protein
MSSNQINCVEQYAWVDEALENAWNQPNFEEEDEELNQETFGPAEESVAYISIPMEIDDISVSTISLGDEDVYDYEYDDFSVADADEQEDEAEPYEYAAAAGDAYGYAAPIQGNEDEEEQDVAWDVPIWYRQTTHMVLNDGTVVYNGHADGRRVHEDDDDTMDVV